LIPGFLVSKGASCFRYRIVAFWAACWVHSTTSRRESVKARPVIMNGERKPFLSPLAEAEMEVLEEGREWMRRRLEKKLQKMADAEGDFSPLQREGSAAAAQASHRGDHERGRS